MLQQHTTHPGPASSPEQVACVLVDDEAEAYKPPGKALQVNHPLPLRRLQGRECLTATPAMLRLLLSAAATTSF